MCSNSSHLGVGFGEWVADSSVTVWDTQHVTGGGVGRTHIRARTKFPDSRRVVLMRRQKVPPSTHLGPLFPRFHGDS